MLATKLEIASDLAKKRERTKKMARADSYLTRFQMFVGLIMPALGLLLVPVLIAQNQNVYAATTLIGSVVAGIVTLRFYGEHKSAIAPLALSETVVAAPQTLKAAVHTIVGPFCERARVDINSVDVALDRRSYAGTPTVRYSKAGPVLVLPLGFLRLLQETPDQAKAMLEHEMAHVDQEDTGLWSQANLFHKLTMKVMVPYAIFNVIVAGISIPVSNNLVAQAEAHIQQQVEANQKQIDEFYAKEKEKAEAAEKNNFGWSAGSASDLPSIQVMMNEFSSNTDLMLAESKAMSELPDPGTAWFGLFSTVFGLLVYFALDGSMQRVRTRSELMADQAVAIYSDSRPLRQALEGLVAGAPKGRLRRQVLTRIKALVALEQRLGGHT